MSNISLNFFSANVYLQEDIEGKWSFLRFMPIVFSFTSLQGDVLVGIFLNTKERWAGLTKVIPTHQWGNGDGLGGRGGRLSRSCYIEDNVAPSTLLHVLS
jgi:hypothetical protein